MRFPPLNGMLFQEDRELQSGASHGFQLDSNCKEDCHYRLDQHNYDYKSGDPRHPLPKTNIIDI